MLPNSEPETELPKAQVKRIVKAAIQEAANRSGASEKEHTISKDALLAFSESAKVFVHYLTATANDICRESKRQTISGRDVIAALEDLDFKELVEPLKEAMEDFKQAKANADRAKKSKTAAATPEQESPWQGSSGARPGEPGPATPVDTAGPGSWSEGRHRLRQRQPPPRGKGGDDAAVGPG
eukprot:CAMPEP_0177581974 /NCGR_PEP_ID=MMETSP0419_2-20121207/2452_1 /TAXON_ID=582737 /ORGANISM="Tetraselmis sp., Strain GSL018" /LENGTH=181 /DNA_ID=CAMNT_0019071089 /DNA_START=302 /DNA_END=843 /DNA_ORIENTATION=-